MMTFKALMENYHLLIQQISDDVHDSHNAAV